MKEKNRRMMLRTKLSQSEDALANVVDVFNISKGL